jgi:hypothetical protein
MDLRKDAPNGLPVAGLGDANVLLFHAESLATEDRELVAGGKAERPGGRGHRRGRFRGVRDRRHDGEGKKKRGGAAHPTNLATGERFVKLKLTER